MARNITYPPGTICVCCFADKADENRPRECVTGKRHVWNTEPLTIKVERVKQWRPSP